MNTTNIMNTINIKCPRSVISELHRAASLLDGTTEDTITFFDETRNKEQKDYEKLEPPQQSSNKAEL